MVRRGISGTAGTAAVEFALVLPMLLFLVLGAVEMGFRILSHASMNTTMARVPDLARRADSTGALDGRLAELAALRLGLGLVDVAFDPVTESCLCPADLIDLAEDTRTCPLSCDGGVEALRLYTVTGQVTVPSLVPGGDTPGVHRLDTRLTVTAP
ncbi:TadE/TadG family type IV pilus assembly protein [Meridianimarinicoccus sp. RP-17]|uniref:TadE/TadG family type IV pilus assembly protein n=1 Tax=Meridianimarinicoccus zhengii TaxID=2056810 RepID=UPI000DAE000A|nr:TadE family protein [Phycocomes zhengii]